MSVDERWVAETFNASFRPILKANRVLLEKRTGIQDLLIFDNDHFGRVLVLDGVYQLTTADEFIYHEMMAHVPLMAHPDPKSVLIVGGGDGGVLREVLRHPSVESATLCEIDSQVIDACREYLPAISDGAYDNPRTTLIIDDAAKFLASTQLLFDAIIIDTSEPVGPNEVIFQENLLADCTKRLAPGGALVMQTGISFMSLEHISNTGELMRGHFNNVTAYIATTPTYAGGSITMGFASDTDAHLEVSEVELVARMKDRGITGTKYYTPAVHKAAFALPPYIQNAVDG